MADYDAFESAAPSQVEKLLLAPSDMDSAVVSRSTVKFRPQGTSTYGSGSRTMQFRLSSSDYASLDTLTFGFKLTRKYANCVQEDLFALSCIQDLRVEVAGVVCEDLRGVNRCIKPLIYAGVDANFLRGGPHPCWKLQICANIQWRLCCECGCCNSYITGCRNRQCYYSCD